MVSVSFSFIEVLCLVWILSPYNIFFLCFLFRETQRNECPEFMGQFMRGLLMAHCAVVLLLLYLIILFNYELTSIEMHGLFTCFADFI